MKRGKGEGSIFKDKSGRYRAFVTAGYSPEGKQIKKWVYGQTRAEAAAKLAKLLPTASAGLVNTARITVAEWLERWANQRASAKGLAPGTVKNHGYYRQRIDLKLGRVRLRSLNIAHVNALVAELGTGSHPKHIFEFLRAALEDARIGGYIEHNPANDVEAPPATPKRPAAALRRDQIKALLTALEGSRWHTPVRLALTIGLRPGELLALRWEHLEPPYLTVPGTKTENALRVVQLDPATLELLEAHRREQKRLKHARRKVWQEHGLMFPSTTGTPWSLPNYRADLNEYLEARGMGRVLPQNLRHTYVSLAVPLIGLKETSRRVGHASPAFTAKTYQHLHSEDLERSAKSLEELVDGGRKEEGVKRGVKRKGPGRTPRDT